MFCNYCGQKNPDGAKFCSNCGKPLNCTEAPTSSESMTFTVTIFRESQTYLINPPINLTVDDTENYSIPNGGSLKLDLSEGEHELLFFQSLRKRSVSLDVSGNISITVKWNRITGSIEAQVHKGR
ncbi:MAG: zinc ribbon domain-containing protein [Oscillospiraceae bacterium]